MIGYAIALPIRIAIFAIALFKLIEVFFRTLFKGEFSQLGGRMKSRSLIFLGATGELVTGAIGCVCPPLAYLGDEVIQSNYQIHSWYRDLLKYGDVSFMSVAGILKRAS